MNHLTRNVRYLRGDLTQDEYAQAVGVNQSTIQRLLAGRVSPSLDTVAAIAKYHRITLDDLVNRDLQKDGPSDSHGGRPSVAKLGVALVAVEQAIRNMNLDPERSWGKLAKLVLWAVDLQDEVYPDGVNTEADRRGFDAQVQLRMGGTDYDEVRTLGQNAPRSNERGARAAAPRKAHRRSRKRGNS